MYYNSTRDKSISVSASAAISQGISADGGLFVPEKLPHYTADELKTLAPLSYNDRAKRILADFLSDFSKDEIEASVDAAYTAEKFGSDNPAPMSQLTSGDRKMCVLELWHGPTSAFKDMALQLLPQLLTRSMHKAHDGEEAVILVATSGDTGKAALEGFKDVDGTKMMVFYPENGVSPMQKRQMTTQKGENVKVFAIGGNFDDAQTGVKKIFTNDDMKKKLADNKMIFSSANSINWGRLLPQIVYYISAYCDLCNAGVIAMGDSVNITVPTGNFGNILAAFYAKNMGIPVKKLICASNANNVLTEFLETGTYDRNRDFYATMSPSMDILVSSNLERLLYNLTGDNDSKVAEWMKSLSETGKYTVDDDVKKQLDELFFGGFCDDKQTQATIKKVYENEHYLCDTHTAVAFNVYEQYVEKTGDAETPVIIASTASPYKFAKNVLGSIAPEQVTEDEFATVRKLSELTGTEIPKPLAELENAEVRFTETCAANEMKDVVLEALGIKD